MASVNPLSGLISGDKQWVDHISKTLKKQIAITIDTPPVSIFQIPQPLKDEKLQAYVPQRIGLGPNHHFQSELYQKMEQNKLTAVKRVLKSDKVQVSEDQVVEKVKQIIPIICACYDFYLDADDDTLAWLFAIDGLFFLDQLDAYFDQFAIDAKDLIMLENQIPSIVLKEIHKAISGGDAEAQEDYWESKFGFFCKSHSPFTLSKEKVDFSQINHLLDYMYHSIVNNETSASGEVYFRKPGSGPSKKDNDLQLLDQIFIQIIEQIPVIKPFLQIIESFKKVFLESIENKVTTEEIKVPSVSELRDIAGVKFHLSSTNGGIRDINFVLEKERSCYLPLITLNSDSEVILRNLVAYEQLMANSSFTGGYGLELTEYVDFMCGIIDNAKDVSLLRGEKIIVGDLGDEEIVKMFNGIGRSRGKMNTKSELRKTVEQLNKVYGSMPRIWVQRMAKKELRTLTKIIAFLVSISSSLALIREVYLKAYGSSPPSIILDDIVRTTMSLFLHCNL